MPREIKFRAWLKDEKKMVDVSSIDFRIEEIAYEEQCTLASMLQAWYEFSYFNDIELMQYTGLKDKNGVEIYEGDIIKIGNGKWNYIVTFDHGSFGYSRDGKYGLSFDDNDCPIEQSEVEVIGNIYENKELLNEN